MKSNIYLKRFKAAKVAVVPHLLFALPKTLQTLANAHKKRSLDDKI